MLGACREKCRSRGLKASLYEQLMHQIDLPRKYKLVFIPSGSFGLLERDHARQSLQRLHALMLPGATLLIEIDRYTPRPSSSWPWGGRWVQRPDGAKIIISWLGYHDAETRVTRSIHKYELVKDGKLLETEFEDFSGPTYEEHEFRDLLTSTGFAAIRTRKLYAMRDADPTDEEVVFECTRS